MKDFKIRGSSGSKITGKRGLGKTGESYLKQWLKEQEFNRKYEFTSKYTQKGLINEDESIDFIADHLNYGMLMKNEDFFQNDFMQGTPDIILKDHIIDVKNSWDVFTFPYYDNEVNQDYYWQGQVYMALTGKTKYKVIYTLTNTPVNLITKEAYFWCKNNGFDELDEDVYNSFLKKMTYDDLPDEKRIKIFEFDRNDKDIILIEERVKECREYLETIK